MYNVAIVGCGVIGNRLADAFAAHDDTTVWAACDLVEEKVESFATEHDCEAYTDYEAMVAEEQVDVVYVGVPPKVHCEVVEAAVDAGNAVICEKPIAEDATVEQSLWTAQRLVDAVWHAHHRGVVHLDLKPSNVLFTSGEPDRWPIPKVADWELSRSLLGQGAAVGISTPGYCAPEQDGQGTTDQRTDQFQLGIVLYELFTGTHPFVDDFAATPQRERIERVLDADHRPPSERRPELPAALDDVFERALARDPADRYEATIDLRRALERIAGEWESTPDDPESATEPATADRDSTPTTDHSAPETTSTDRSRPTADDRDWPTLHGSASRSGPRQSAVGPTPPVTER